MICQYQPPSRKCGRAAACLITAGCENMHIHDMRYCIEHLDLFRKRGHSFYQCSCGGKYIEYVYKYGEDKKFYTNANWGSFVL